MLGRQLQRQDAHADQVGAVDPLEAVGQHRTRAQERRTLGGPVARRAGAVVPPGEDDRRHALGAIALGRAIEGQELARGRMNGPARRGASGQSRLRTERLVNRPRTMASKLPRREEKTLRSFGFSPASISQLPGLALGRDRAGGRDVVGGDVVAEHDQRRGAQLLHAGRRVGQCHERRAAQVGRARDPRGSAGRPALRARPRPARRSGRRRRSTKSSGPQRASASAAVISSSVGQMSARNTGAAVAAPADRLARRCRDRRARRARRRSPAAARPGRRDRACRGRGPESCGCPRARPRRRHRARWIASAIAGTSGPELPMQVVQPKPTMPKPSASRSVSRPLRRR